MKNNALIFNKLILGFIAFSYLGACTPIGQTSTSDVGGKTLQLSDQAYEHQIKTVKLHPAFNEPQANLLPAVTKLGQPNLLLQFDDLRSERDLYYARIIHCNYDWTRSMLQDLEFLAEFNEFPVNNFEFSVDTHIPYVHYWLNIPQVKLPGNYVVVVYRGSDKDDVILSRRFMVYDTRIAFANERNLIGAGNVARLNQQINFTINYGSIDLINPLETVNVTIRQNQRWDNIATKIKPSFVREIEKQLEYRFFDDSKMFKGGNEFRFFDLRSLNSPGRNVDFVKNSVKPFQATLVKDKTRQHEAYAQYQDLNGGFINDNYDYRDASYSNYADVTFRLSSPKLNGEVYVTGAFNYWNLGPENRMTYDSTQKLYTSTFLMKQGWYDYQYYVQSKGLAPYVLEGSHFETENQYEIFVYYRALRPSADLLIGYVRLDKNER
ncbi:MAG TPA: DUF5103 domain-containing protein [Chryseosolibacter sp.]